MANDSYKAQKVTRSFQLSVMVKARFLLTFLTFFATFGELPFNLDRYLLKRKRVQIMTRLSTGNHVDLVMS